jgi:hypothetical protein
MRTRYARVWATLSGGKGSGEMRNNSPAPNR